MTNPYQAQQPPQAPQQQPTQPSPYAAPQQPAYPPTPSYPQQPGYTQQPSFTQQPSAPVPPQYAAAQTPPPPYGTPGDPGQGPKKRKTGILIGSIVGGVVLVAAAAVVAVMLLSGEESGDSKAAGTPTPSSKATPSPKPTQSSEPKPSPEPSPEPEDPDNERAVYGPNDPEIGGTGDIGDRLEAFKTQLEVSNDDGTLWQKIPETKENLGAYVALQFLLTDMRSASRFGSVSEETAVYYAKHAKHLENQLLAQKPLGDSVHYTMQDGTVFDYNGKTGEVNVTEPEG